MLFTKLKFILVGLFLLAVILIPTAPAKAACSGQECLFGQACQGANSNVCDQAKNQGTDNPVSGPNGIISTAANLIAAFAGVVAVIIIIISGIMYVTAGGAIAGQRAGDNPNRAKKAQSTLIGALIGLVIIALSWTITRFIVDRVIQ